MGLVKSTMNLPEEVSRGTQSISTSGHRRVCKESKCLGYKPESPLYPLN